MQYHSGVPFSRQLNLCKETVVRGKSMPRPWEYTRVYKVIYARLNKTQAHGMGISNCNVKGFHVPLLDLIGSPPPSRDISD